MPMWKYFTLCRENEVGRVLRTCSVFAFTFTLLACVAGPTPHPAEPNQVANAPEPTLGGETEDGAGIADTMSSGDIFGSLADASDTLTETGPDAGDTTSDGGDTASDGGD